MDKPKNKKTPSPKETTDIVVKGCRVHNLKGIDVQIPRNKLTVITGVSGSGKSSLAFDTLYAEGHRRYVESLSSYARQFLDRMHKPDCDEIRNLPPAVAIEQRVVSRNPRSTVGTSSEIYDYIRLLMARAGKLISPTSGREVKKHTADDVIAAAVSLPTESKVMLLALIDPAANRTPRESLNLLLSQGYTRRFYQDKPIRIEEFLEQNASLKKLPPQLYLIIDRLTVNKEDDIFLSRLGDSVDIAFYEGKGTCALWCQTPDAQTCIIPFSNLFEEDGRQFEEPTPEGFNFNSPSGACPTCEGYGSILGIDPLKVIPDPELSLYDDAVACWKGPMSSKFKEDFMLRVRDVAPDFDVFKPYRDYTPQEHELLWWGFPKDKKVTQRKTLYGINDYFDMLQRDVYKIQNRTRIARFRGKTTCPDCNGARLKADMLLVQYHGKNVAQINQMSIRQALDFFSQPPADKQEQKITERLLHEITSRLQVLCEVGLGYLTIDRRSNTLSGGESQRINLATRLGNGLVGSLYVLDEPSIGLHERDTDRLIGVLHKLRDQGNTVVVVEHDERTMRAADYLIDIGPNAGRLGGEVIFAGAPKQISPKTPGYTAAYLSGTEQIPLPAHRLTPKRRIQISHATMHNLKDVEVQVPLNMLTVVTGVSGSGKSTLVREVLFNELEAYLNDGYRGTRTEHLSGCLGDISAVTYVDQTDVGRSSRSNPVTYIGAYTYIRSFYSELPFARQMGYQPYFFSFNKDGGRCPTCNGEGTIVIPMQFMTDLVVVCDECGGKRFSKQALEVECDGCNISDVLNMTVNKAVEFFAAHHESPHSAPIVRSLQALQRVGLGYLQLGQSSSTLSGGENQRLKLAKYLAEPDTRHTLFFFDEPTTGLHFHDISTLLESLRALVSRGHSVVVIEHNPEVIKCADYLIDLGPDGGADGGEIVAVGTPEEVAANPRSLTGLYLKDKLRPASKTNSPL